MYSCTAWILDYYVCDNRWDDLVLFFYRLREWISEKTEGTRAYTR